ncbi:hypothetical protein CEE36_06835 [candidate division TA06 bacterium B3_TA06]|uniref:Methyltransferase domain-containing protein n=1 Tax=candidate division TA06 bacterium B3_TA06 TaxID=2012487 RepID=A0A532V5Z0_UNCT6|nr:MAG: hypothetical protein CEE36_06835 [candidate division TA06 bacterium B3_TA06]
MPGIELTQQIRRFQVFLQIQWVRRVLLLGAEDTQSALIFVRKGFELTVLDPPQETLDGLAKELDAAGLSARLLKAAPGDLPVPLRHFDFAVGFNCLYQTTLEGLTERFEGLLSGIRKDGFFYITLISTKNTNYRKDREIEPQTFADKGEMRHYCDAREIVTLLRHMEVIDLRNAEQGSEGSFHWHVLGRNRDMAPAEEDESDS